MQVARLLNEHAKLRSLGGILVALVSSPEPCDWATLAKRRWELARMVHQHLAYEDRQLFQRLADDPRREFQEAAREGRRGIERLHSLYKTHVERWTETEVTADWPEFQAAVKTMVMRMTLKLDREEQDLFPLIAGEPELAPRWQPGTRNWAGDGMAMQPLITASSNARPTHLSDVGKKPLNGQSR